ncbi:hypothetical protein TGMAS_248170, partial [Toxoplasma gondii MAS]
SFVPPPSSYPPSFVPAFPPAVAPWAPLSGADSALATGGTRTSNGEGAREARTREGEEKGGKSNFVYVASLLLAAAGAAALARLFSTSALFARPYGQVPASAAASLSASAKLKPSREGKDGKAKGKEGDEVAGGRREEVEGESESDDGGEEEEEVEEDEEDEDEYDDENETEEDSEEDEEAEADEEEKTDDQDEEAEAEEEQDAFSGRAQQQVRGCLADQQREVPRSFSPASGGRSEATGRNKGRKTRRSNSRTPSNTDAALSVHLKEAPSGPRFIQNTSARFGESHKRTRLTGNDYRELLNLFRRQTATLDRVEGLLESVSYLVGNRVSRAASEDKKIPSSLSHLRGSQDSPRSSRSSSSSCSSPSHALAFASAASSRPLEAARDKASRREPPDELAGSRSAASLSSASLLASLQPWQPAPVSAASRAFAEEPQIEASEAGARAWWLRMSERPRRESAAEEEKEVGGRNKKQHSAERDKSEGRGSDVDEDEAEERHLKGEETCENVRNEKAAVGRAASVERSKRGAREVERTETLRGDRTTGAAGGRDRTAEERKERPRHEQPTTHIRAGSASQIHADERKIVERAFEQVARALPPSLAEKRKALGTLVLMLSNIEAAPTEAERMRYSRINTQSPRFEERFKGMVEEVAAFLQAVGFHLQGGMLTYPATAAVRSVVEAKDLTLTHLQSLESSTPEPAASPLPSSLSSSSSSSSFSSASAAPSCTGHYASEREEENRAQSNDEKAPNREESRDRRKDETDNAEQRAEDAPVQKREADEGRDREAGETRVKGEQEDNELQREGAKNDELPEEKRNDIQRESEARRSEREDEETLAKREEEDRLVQREEETLAKSEEEDRLVQREEEETLAKREEEDRLAPSRAAREGSEETTEGIRGYNDEREKSRETEQRRAREETKAQRGREKERHCAGSRRLSEKAE